MNARGALLTAGLAWFGSVAPAAADDWARGVSAAAPPSALEYPDALPAPPDEPPLSRVRGPWWGGPGALNLRWGVDVRADRGDGLRPFVGMGLATGRGTMLFYEQGAPLELADAGSPAALDTGTRMGIEFRPRSRSREWREFGTLRLQVGLNSRLLLRPRSGGLKVSWQTRF